MFTDTGAPFQNPPGEIVDATDPSNPANVEHRDYLKVEKDAWAARKRIGDIPVTIVSVKYSDAAVSESPFPSIVVHTGHAVEEDDPDLVIDVILDVVKASR